jgi:hypothetical protein
MYATPFASRRPVWAIFLSGGAVNARKKMQISRGGAETRRENIHNYSIRGPVRNSRLTKIRLLCICISSASPRLRVRLSHGNREIMTATSMIQFIQFEDTRYIQNAPIGSPDVANSGQRTVRPSLGGQISDARQKSIPNTGGTRIITRARSGMECPQPQGSIERANIAPRNGPKVLARSPTTAQQSHRGLMSAPD